MRHVSLFCFAMSMQLLLAMPVLAQTTGNYSRPPNSWTCSSTSPAVKNLTILLASRPWARCSPRPPSPSRPRVVPGPLVLVAVSDIYVYDSRSGARLAQERFRADRASGFYELTAISHIGPALAYLAQIKASGDARWKARLASLQMHVAQVRALNQRATSNWLDQLDQPAWSARKAQFAIWSIMLAPDTELYRVSGNGDSFTVAGVNDDFFNGTSARYPIPFVNVMIGTFMLEALRGAADVHGSLSRLKLDWPRAMVLVSSRAGSNVSSGLTEGTNWLVLFLKAASGFTLPDDRIKIVPMPKCDPRLVNRSWRQRIAIITCSACGARCSTARSFPIRFSRAFRPSTSRTARRCPAITS